METVKTKWAIDPYHTQIIFKVKHLVISTVADEVKLALNVELAKVQ
ncbi:MAG: hypothetical protein NTY96_12780 [Bacteroidetes bacterium]|nr:hypothetical protein [Bacteroidota bacterium]